MRERRIIQIHRRLKTGDTIDMFVAMERSAGSGDVRRWSSIVGENQIEFENEDLSRMRNAFLTSFRAFDDRPIEFQGESFSDLVHREAKNKKKENRRQSIVNIPFLLSASTSNPNQSHVENTLSP